MAHQKTDHLALRTGPSILIVEDNPDDAELTVRALQRAHVLNPTLTVHRGDEALQLLQRHGDNDAPFIGLVLLDLNLPGTDGRAVLEAMHADPVLREIPVVVLTGSESTRDRLSCYERGVLGFLCKPIDVRELLRVLANLTGGGFYFIRQAA